MPESQVRIKSFSSPHQPLDMSASSRYIIYLPRRCNMLGQIVMTDIKCFIKKSSGNYLSFGHYIASAGSNGNQIVINWSESSHL